MGSRGPIGKKQLNTQAKAKALRMLPADYDRTARRMLRDLDGLTIADVALVEDMARWVTIGQEAFRQLRRVAAAAAEAGAAPAKDADRLALTVTDTTHGNGEEARKNPLLIVLRTASEQLRADAAQLGATPMARARLPQNEQNEMSLADMLFADVDAHG